MEPLPTRLDLPAPLTPLIGRAPEVMEITARLRDEHARLVTLTGPGGVGKTRLALDVAANVGSDFADGVAFVALAAVRDPALVVSTIAHRLGVSETGGRPAIERVGGALRDRHLLLVLDNVEHLLAAAPLVSDLLARCPRVAVLATSRAPLHLAGEQDMAILPLAVPDVDHLPGLADVAEMAAIRLFVDRARAVDATFALTTDNAPAVAAICHRLDGLPLAIELAAARSRLLAPAALLPRLARRLPLLTTGWRDAPRRHRTMRDAIAWSYDILAPVEQALFRRLAVFVGGFTLEAAALAAANDDQEVLERVAALLDNSLLRRLGGAGAEPRYEMLETVREYAEEQLALSGETETLRDRHATWCLELAEQAAPSWFTSTQAAWGDRLEAEHDNVRAALTWAAARGGTGDGARLAGQLWPFWYVRGYHAEGLAWLQRALAWDAGAPSLARVRILTGAACLARCQGADACAAAWDEEAWQIVETIGAGASLEAVHVRIGRALDAIACRDFARATAWSDEALTAAQELTGIVPSAASIASSILNILAEIAVEEGDDARAAHFAGAALAWQRRASFLWAAADALFLLALVARRRGNLRSAAAHCAEGLELSRDHRDPQQVPLFLEQIAFLAGATGRTTAAARLIGAAERLSQRLGIASDRGGDGGRARQVAAVRAALGEPAYGTAVAAGRALSLDHARAEAVALAVAIAG